MGTVDIRRQSTVLSFFPWYTPDVVSSIKLDEYDPNSPYYPFLRKLKEYDDVIAKQEDGLCPREYDLLVDDLEQGFHITSLAPGKRMTLANTGRLLDGKLPHHTTIRVLRYISASKYYDVIADRKGPGSREVLRHVKQNWWLKHPACSHLGDLSQVVEAFIKLVQQRLKQKGRGVDAELEGVEAPGDRVTCQLALQLRGGMSTSRYSKVVANVAAVALNLNIMFKGFLEIPNGFKAIGLADQSFSPALRQAFNEIWSSDKSVRALRMPYQLSTLFTPFTALCPCLLVSEKNIICPEELLLLSKAIGNQKDPEIMSCERTLFCTFEKLATGDVASVDLLLEELADRMIREDWAGKLKKSKHFYARGQQVGYSPDWQLWNAHVEAPIPSSWPITPIGLDLCKVLGPCTPSSTDIQQRNQSEPRGAMTANNARSASSRQQQSANQDQSTSAVAAQSHMPNPRATSNGDEVDQMILESLILGGTNDQVDIDVLSSDDDVEPPPAPAIKPGNDDVQGSVNANPGLQKPSGDDDNNDSTGTHQTPRRNPQRPGRHDGPLIDPSAPTKPRKPPRTCDTEPKQPIKPSVGPPSTDAVPHPHSPTDAIFSAFKSVRNRDEKAWVPPTTRQSRSQLPVREGRKTKTLRIDEPSPKFTDHAPFEARLYRANGDLYTWQGFAHTQDQATEMKAVFSTLEEDYVSPKEPNREGDGKRPRFLNDPDSSCIFRIPEAEFLKWSPREVQDALRTRNILVYDCQRRPLPFNYTSAESLGPLDRRTDIQDQSSSTVDGDLQTIVRSGTARQVVENALGPHAYRKSLNSLNHPDPLAESTIKPYSSELWAWRKSNSGDHFATNALPPISDLRWGLLGTTGAKHGIHIDAHGFGTFVAPQCGLKLWMLGRPKPPLTTSSISVWCDPEFDVDAPNSHLWAWEGVVLGPDTTLIMRPNTAHRVITLENSIVHGGHFIATSTLHETHLGMVHTTLRGHINTNNSHPVVVLELMQRLMAAFHREIVICGLTHKEDPFLPRFETSEDVMNFFMFCVSIELQNVLSPLTYSSSRQYDLTDVPYFLRIGAIRTRGLMFDVLDHLLANVDLIPLEGGDDDIPLHGLHDIFFPMLAWQICALRRYITLVNAADDSLDGSSPPGINRISRTCFNQQLDWVVSSHVVLQEEVEKLEASGNVIESLNWTYPKFSLRRRQPPSPHRELESSRILTDGLRPGDSFYLVATMDQHTDPTVISLARFLAPVRHKLKRAQSEMHKQPTKKPRTEV
ncbi:hypothetical protein CC1G_11256 [Coprinopsis cinerea okayama7|uniref:JmjC domain-containing protein n=1 Tax=Coprinopsis cinerea (strain Okayama-7 / 130 / ATCC MYA-4618 / FGSC 9003) TaxID=240176 RepID=A8NLR2_COPC7|nr:hypothetical protein CC1G_11256 [Coprinopsis cinerea okayama7\|eukprot:XP_001834757.2 hypothetical protein CC1G_11256 [Coprinopsis cinerea okayama7\